MSVEMSGTDCGEVANSFSKISRQPGQMCDALVPHSGFMQDLAGPTVDFEKLGATKCQYQYKNAGARRVLTELQ